MSGRFVLGLAIGLAIGGAAYAYSRPTVRSWVDENLDAARKGAGPAARPIDVALALKEKVLEMARARYLLARAEGEGIAEQTRKELWRKFEIAKAEGHAPKDL